MGFLQTVIGLFKFLADPKILGPTGGLLVLTAMGGYFLYGEITDTSKEAQAAILANTIRVEAIKETQKKEQLHQARTILILKHIQDDIGEVKADLKDTKTRVWELSRHPCKEGRNRP